MQVMERATLGHSFSLTNERHCMGVREGEKSGEVVLTFNNGAVKAYNVSGVCMSCRVYFCVRIYVCLG